MGLILGPLLLLWIIAAGFSIYMGNTLLNDYQIFQAYMIAIGTTVSYVLLNLIIRYGNKKELWIFEIPFFFTTNKISLFLYGASIFFYVWGDALKAQEYGNEMIFVLNFTISFSAIIGTFSNDVFMKTFEIKRTH
ncbi:hypothetical protein CYL31_04840 [Marinomonas sp. A3A]|jgi:hypothetical protein|uniref:hypothetical protein n=1 Tax=Marinomonas TaxID=28253 RepID=UPI001BB36673|nr:MULTISPECIES: hypothetical protein [Marinomonas]QUX90767.1 hypothetical protein CYL31_04840 [Marinomonas sp. A3A]